MGNELNKTLETEQNFVQFVDLSEFLSIVCGTSTFAICGLAQE